MSKPTLSLLCVLLTLCALAVKVQAVSYACNYVVRYENCPDVEQTVCSVYPGVCVSDTCQPSEYYNPCYACSDPTVMAYSIGVCGSDTGSGTPTDPSNPSNPTNNTNSTNSTNPSNPSDPSNPTNGTNGSNGTNGTGSNPGNDGNNTETDPELINSGASEILSGGDDASYYNPEGSDVSDIIGNDIANQEIDVDSFFENQSASVSTTSRGLQSSTSLRTSFYVVVYCDNTRPTSCTNDVNPVCAISCQNGVCQKTVNNICLACADTNILSYSLGSCELQNISCPSIDFATDTTTCTSFYDPVCAYPSGCTSKSCATTVTNSCGACYTSRASYFTLGPC